MTNKILSLIESLDQPLSYERFTGALPSYVFDEWRFEVNGATHVVRFLRGDVNGKRTLIITFGKKQGNNVIKRYDGITNIRQYLATVLAIFQAAMDNPTAKTENRRDGFDLMFTPKLWEKVEARFERMFRFKLSKKYSFSTDYHVTSHNDSSTSFFFWKRGRSFKSVFPNIEATVTSYEPKKTAEVEYSDDYEIPWGAGSQDYFGGFSKETPKPATTKKVAKATPTKSSVAASAADTELLLKSVEIEKKPFTKADKQAALAAGKKAGQKWKEKQAAAGKPFVKVDPPAEVIVAEPEIDAEAERAAALKYVDPNPVHDTSVDYSGDHEKRKELSEYLSAKYLISEDPEVVRGQKIATGDKDELTSIYNNLVIKHLAYERFMKKSDYDIQDYNLTRVVDFESMFTEDERDLFKFMLNDDSKEISVNKTIVGYYSYSKPRDQDVYEKISKALPRVYIRTYDDSYETIPRPEGALETVDAKSIWDIIKPMLMDEELYSRAPSSLISMQAVSAFRYSPMKSNQGEAVVKRALNKIVNALNNPDTSIRTGTIGQDTLNEAHSMLDVDDIYRISKMIPGTLRSTIFARNDFERESKFLDEWFRTTGSTSQLLGSKAFNDVGINAKIGDFWSYADSKDETVQGMLTSNVKCTHKCLAPVRDRFKTIMANIKSMAESSIEKHHESVISNGTVTLYRGIKMKPEKIEFYTPGALESWTENRNVAKDFSGDYGTILTTTISLEHVFLTNLVAQNLWPYSAASEFHKEQEWIIMGGALVDSPVYATEALDANTQSQIRVSRMNEWLIEAIEKEVKNIKKLNLITKKNPDFEKLMSKMAFGNSLEELIGKDKKKK